MVTETLTEAERTMLEGSSGQYTATLKDETGTVIPTADLTALELTLFLASDDTVIFNSRDGQDVYDTNDCTFHATSGLLTWEIQPADNKINDTTLGRGDRELHIAQFKFTWNSGAKIGYRSLPIWVEQLLKVAIA